MRLFACVAYGLFERTRFLTWRSTTRFDRVENVVDSPSLLFLEVFALMMALWVDAGELTGTRQSLALEWLIETNGCPKTEQALSKIIAL